MTQPPELDPETKARIEAEEAYRAQVRSQHQPAEAEKGAEPEQHSSMQKPGCLQIGCGTLVVLGILLFLMTQCGGRSTTTASSAGIDTGSAYVNCTRAVEQRLKFPDEAEFTSAFAVGANGEIKKSGAGAIWISAVKAKNAFGVQSSIPFTCETTSAGDVVNLNMSE